MRKIRSKRCRRLVVNKVLICLAVNPYRHLIRRWNWKSAFLSALMRGILILLANLSTGGARAVGAMFTEVCYRALTSGFCSALTQAFRYARPVWAASIIPIILIPVIADGCELVVHLMLGTQCLGATAAASLIFTAASTSLELFAMRRGVLVMGQNKRPLTEDLKSIPTLIVDFGGEVRRLLLGSFNHRETATHRSDHDRKVVFTCDSKPVSATTKEGLEPAVNQNETLTIAS